MSNKRLTIHDIIALKGQTPIVCLTAYTAPVTTIIDPHTDILLVGDTLGMVIYGMDSTLPVTIDMMVNHGRAVVKHSNHSCIVIDMPFGSYQESPEQAFETAAYIIKETECSAVKLEGGIEMADTIEFLTKRGIPVMAHIGLMPQHVHALGGYRHQGSTKEQAATITESAKAVQKAGAFAVVLEGVKETLAASITEKLTIPTIGIGASPSCDGQILVVDDMAGLTPDFTAKFVQAFGQLGAHLEQSAKDFATAVRARTFPTDQHCY